MDTEGITAVKTYHDGIEELLNRREIRSYKPDGLPPARPVEFMLPTEYRTGTVFRKTLPSGGVVDITAGHVGIGVRLPEALGWPAETACVRLARPTSLQLPPGMLPDELDLFDVHIVGDIDHIEEFKALCPSLAQAMPAPRETMEAYGFPFATGFGRNETGQPRFMVYQTNADDTGLVFFKSNFVAGGGMSGSPVGEDARGVLTGSAYFDDRTGEGPEHWAVVQMLHSDMLMVEV